MLWTRCATHRTVFSMVSERRRINVGLAKTSLFLFLVNLLCRMTVRPLLPTMPTHVVLLTLLWFGIGYSMGSTCCVCAFPKEYSPYLFNRRRVDVTLVVGGDHRLQCHEVADMVVRITSEGGSTFVGEFTNIRLVAGFGTNLMSCPRMVQVGWNINHNRRGLTVSDPKGRVLFTTRASSNGT